METTSSIVSAAAHARAQTEDQQTRPAGWLVKGSSRRVVTEIDRDAYVDDEHLVLHARALHLEAGERREEHLLLVRVLREPIELGAAVNHAHLHLKHHWRVRGAPLATTA